jgi:hypothetical protein
MTLATSLARNGVVSFVFEFHRYAQIKDVYNDILIICCPKLFELAEQIQLVSRVIQPCRSRAIFQQSHKSHTLRLLSCMHASIHQIVHKTTCWVLCPHANCQENINALRTGDAENSGLSRTQLIKASQHKYSIRSKR